MSGYGHRWDNPDERWVVVSAGEPAWAATREEAQALAEASGDRHAFVCDDWSGETWWRPDQVSWTRGMAGLGDRWLKGALLARLRSYSAARAAAKASRRDAVDAVIAAHGEGFAETAAPRPRLPHADD